MGTYTFGRALWKDTGGGCGLAYTRDSFTRFGVCKNQSPLYYPRPFALPSLLQCYCATFAQYMTSARPSLVMPYTIHDW